MSTNTGLYIRLAQEADLKTCVELDHSSVTEYVWQVDVNEQSDAMLYSFRKVRLPRAMSVAYPQDSASMQVDWQLRDYFVVVEADGRICGYLNMREDRACGIGWVRQLVVDRSMRRKRLGSALLRAAQNWAKAIGLKRITIETQTKNHPAISFCQRHGFMLSGFNDHYYPNQDIAIFFSQNLR